MKSSASKVIKSWLNKVNNYKTAKIYRKKIILIGILSVFLLLIFSYFLRPIYFDYDTKKQLVQNKINDSFKLSTEIKGDIFFSFLPSPRIILNNINLDFGKSKNNIINIDKIEILIAPLRIKNIEDFQLKKIIISNQNIKIYPKSISKIFEFFTLHNKKKIFFKNSKIIFIDEQKNSVNFDNVNLEDNFKKNRHKIKGNFLFSNNKININFDNKIYEEKKLKINIPSLKQSLEINFEKSSTLKNLSGQLKLKIFESILLLNFQGKDNFKIKNSYLRNKFLNSKINGTITLKDQFSFNIDLGVNQINLRKLLLYYPLFQSGSVSKKINGKLNILVNSSDTLFGKFKNTKMNLIFENGDIRIKNFSANISENSLIKSNMLVLLASKKPKIEFNSRFSSSDAKKFLRKFGIYDFNNDNLSLDIHGNIDLESNRIKFTKFIRDDSIKISKDTLKNIEDLFNKNVLEEKGVLGLLDFFRFKKLLKEIY